MAPSIPVSLLLTKDVPFEWHDAVAIVAQLVAQVREDIPFAQPRIPELRAITLEETGTLSLSTHAQTLPGMPGAAQILQQLLSGSDQPPPLRLYLMQALTSEPVPTLGAFADELLKWERPNRQQKLATLYARSVVKAGSIAVTDEPPRIRDEVFLRNPVVETPPPAPPPKVKKPKPPPDPDAPNTPMVIGVLVTVAALIIGGAAWYILGRPPAAPVEVQAEDSAPTTKTKLGRKDIVLPPTPKPPAPAIDPPPRGRRPAAPLPAALVEDAQAELARARELFQRQDTPRRTWRSIASSKCSRTHPLPRQRRSARRRRRWRRCRGQRLPSRLKRQSRNTGPVTTVCPTRCHSPTCRPGRIRIRLRRDCRCSRSTSTRQARSTPRSS